MRLRQDLYAIDGRLLMKKGREITRSDIGRIERLGRERSRPRIPVVKTFIYKDLRRVFDDFRYAMMFKPPVSAPDICTIAGSLELEKDIIRELAAMKRDLPYTYRHVLVVTAFSIKIALADTADRRDVEMIAHCAFTHDIGKTRIPRAILGKKARLTRKERSVIETHPAIGYLLLTYYLHNDRRECAEAHLQHHERADGSGYPNGIRKIKRHSRLVSVIDVMDALMTPRPYRKGAFPLRSTLDYLVAQADRGKLDMKIVRTLIRFARKDRSGPRGMRISRKSRQPLPEELSHDKYR